MITALLLCVLAGQVSAAKPPEVDAAEAVRRGESVTVVGEGPRSAVSEAMRLAVAPPPDDSGKWFVTVWSTAGCDPCKVLKKHFRETKELASFVSAPAGQMSWAHYNEYAADDATQKTRREAYRVTKFPTIIVQPPINGMWGNPRTVVFYEVGYNGDAKALSTRISDAVRKYAAAKSAEGYPKTPSTPQYGKAGVPKLSFEALQASEIEEGDRNPAFFVQGPSQAGNSAGGAKEAEGSIGQAPYVTGPPPFNNPPAVDPFNPTLPYGPQPTVPPNQIPPQIPPTTPLTIPDLVSAILNGLASLFAPTNLALYFLALMELLKRFKPIIQPVAPGGPGPSPPSPAGPTSSIGP